MCTLEKQGQKDQLRGGKPKSESGSVFRREPSGRRCGKTGVTEAPPRAVLAHGQRGGRGSNVSYVVGPSHVFAPTPRKLYCTVGDAVARLEFNSYVTFDQCCLRKDVLKHRGLERHVTIAVL